MTAISIRHLCSRGESWRGRSGRTNLWVLGLRGRRGCRILRADQGFRDFQEVRVVRWFQGLRGCQGCRVVRGVRESRGGRRVLGGLQVVVLQVVGRHRRRVVLGIRDFRDLRGCQGCRGFRGLLVCQRCRVDRRCQSFRGVQGFQGCRRVLWARRKGTVLGRISGSLVAVGLEVREVPNLQFDHAHHRLRLFPECQGVRGLREHRCSMIRPVWPLCCGFLRFPAPPWWPPSCWNPWRPVSCPASPSTSGQREICSSPDRTARLLPTSAHSGR